MKVRPVHPGAIDMPAYPRGQIVIKDEVGVYHCTSRCVRRAFLCGVDPLTKKNHEHRKEWIRDRLERLASVFAIDICGYSVMSNHVHVIVRNRPDLVRDWTAEEIALRWKRLYPPRDETTGDPVEPTDSDVNMIASDPERVAELRDRLSDLSWFMRCLNEPIARKANREDECKGRFWEGRFDSQRLLDEAAILTCSIYVDLNPIRAGIAETPEKSEYTSAFDRIRSMLAARLESAPTGTSDPIDPPAGTLMNQGSPSEQRRPDEWLCELTQQEGPGRNSGANPLPSPAEAVSPVVAATEHTTEARPCCSGPDHAARASDQGFLPIPLENYLSLLDWTGRQLRATARGIIPAQFAPILERLGVNGDAWVDTVRNFGKRFKRAVGRRDSLAALAARMGQACFHGQHAAAIAFG
jgi:REP element-mobilizing transposase RayT